ncbi:MAG: hypothetical protein IT370_21505 [Deltaproteobacteria bacterium]|nr:hypothetical protein [Deltaproteobacteria bacterium]
MLAAWEVVRESLPGWSADTELWGRRAGDDIELVLCDHAQDAFDPDSWMFFLVRGETVAEEYAVDATDWAQQGFERLTPVITPSIRYATLTLYTFIATEAPTLPGRRAAAARARALVPELTADLASGALELGFPDRATAAADLAAAESALAAVEASLGQ